MFCRATKNVLYIFTESGENIHQYKFNNCLKKNAKKKKTTAIQLAFDKLRKIQSKHMIDIDVKVIEILVSKFFV